MTAKKSRTSGRVTPKGTQPATKKHHHDDAATEERPGFVVREQKATFKPAPKGGGMRPQSHHRGNR